MLETIYAENSEQFLWETDLKIVHCICLCVQMKKKNLLIFMFMFICWLSKKKGIRNKELELVKLEFHTEVQKRAFTTLAQVFLLNSSIKNSIYTENLSFMNSSLKKSGILLLFLQTMVCCY